MSVNGFNQNRRGAVAALMALLLIPMLALVALCVDYGYLLNVRTELQRTADAAVLAAVRDLVPSSSGFQDLVKVRDTVRDYVSANVAGGLEVLDSDIEIGRFNPDTIYAGVELLDDGIYDTVRLTLRRDSSVNSPVALFFARVMGFNESDVGVTAAAVLQKANSLPPGADILPIGIPLSTWLAQNPGQTWSVYGDGKIQDDSGQEIPGNWGTMDIGASSNATSGLNEQILTGLDQQDLNQLYGQGRIDSADKIGGNEEFWSSGETGLSTGMKSSIEVSHGKIKLMPIVDASNGDPGENLEYHVVGWGVVVVTDSSWNGAKKTYVKITKSYTYDGDLTPNPDLGDTTNIIQAAYTSPVLVE